jgi:NAD(P)-dependent dehydrogenase (short-subunit alcohol dehydrogenase family)
MRIEGAAALVTGGASGLGEATVRALLDAGADVTIVDRDIDRADALAADLGKGVKAVQADVAAAEQVARAVELAGESAPLRVAVSCAGIGWVSRVVDRQGNPHDLDAFMTVLRVNLVGTFNVLRLAAAAMSKTEPVDADGSRGVVVNTASVAAFEGQIGQIAYSASKGAVVALTLPAARDLSSVGVRVVTIAPGTFDTPLLALLPDENRQALGAAVPFPKRLGNPAEYGALVRHIAENDMLNGEVIRLDGAIRMPPK